MRCLLVFACLLFVGLATAQESIEPRYEKDGDKVKVTYFHSNGEVHQQGFFKDKKPEGLWTQFDSKGNKVSQGYYKNGKRDGVWLYWKGNIVKEVTYLNNKIIEVVEKEEGVKIASN